MGEVGVISSGVMGRQQADFVLVRVMVRAFIT